MRGKIRQRYPWKPWWFIQCNSNDWNPITHLTNHWTLLRRYGHHGTWWTRIQKSHWKDGWGNQNRHGMQTNLSWHPIHCFWFGYWNRTKHSDPPYLSHYHDSVLISLKSTKLWNDVKRSSWIMMPIAPKSENWLISQVKILNGCQGYVDMHTIRVNIGT